MHQQICEINLICSKWACCLLISWNKLILVPYFLTKPGCKGELPHVNYGAYTLRSSDGSQGSVAKLMCLEGYKTADNSTLLTCKIRSQKPVWNGTVGVCTPKGNV